MSGEVRWCADNRHTQVRTDAYRDHVFGHQLAWANARIILLRDDIGETIVDHDLHLDVGVLRKDFGQGRHEDCVRRVLGRGYSDGTAGFFAQCAQSRQPHVHFIELGPDR